MDMLDKTLWGGGGFGRKGSWTFYLETLRNTIVADKELS